MNIGKIILTVPPKYSQ